jgi:hypothetical protein
MNRNISGERKLTLSIQETQRHQKKFFKVSELAARYDFTTTSIRAWINEGKIKATKFGPGKTSGFRISEEEVRRIDTEGI